MYQVHPRWCSGKESACHCRRCGLGRSPGGGNGNTLQYSCLGNPMDRGACQATICGIVKQSKVTEQLSTHNIYQALCELLGTARLDKCGLFPQLFSYYRKVIVPLLHITCFFWFINSCKRIISIYPFPSVCFPRCIPTDFQDAII